MNKFTPGEWNPYSDGSKAFVKTEKHFICELHADVERCDADARLIAAAPDMYRAMKEMAWAREEMSSPGGIRSAKDHKRYQAAEKAFEYALNKAEGKL